MQVLTKDELLEKVLKDGKFNFKPNVATNIVFVDDTNDSYHIVEFFKKIGTDETMDTILVEAANGEYFEGIGRIETPMIMFVPLKNKPIIYKGYASESKLKRLIFEHLFEFGIEDAEIIEIIE